MIPLYEARRAWCAVRTLCVWLTTALAMTVMVAAAQLPRVARDLDGVSYQLTKPSPGDVHLLVFIGAECPISNRYAPEIARIAAEYSSRHVRTFLIYADAGIDAVRARAHQAEFYGALHVPVVIDPGGEWLAATGTTSRRKR